jgi:hypothetical protein
MSGNSKIMSKITHIGRNIWDMYSGSKKLLEIFPCLVTEQEQQEQEQGLRWVIFWTPGGVGIHAALSLVFRAPGRGQWCTLVRPDCVYALDHADCVLVASDKPGHITYLTVPYLFNSCPHYILYIDLAGGFLFLGCLARPGTFLQHMALFCL